MVDTPRNYLGQQEEGIPNYPLLTPLIILKYECNFFNTSPMISEVYVPSLESGLVLVTSNQGNAVEVMLHNSEAKWEKFMQRLLCFLGMLGIENMAKLHITHLITQRPTCWKCHGSHIRCNHVGKPSSYEDALPSQASKWLQPWMTPDPMRDPK